MSDSLQPYVLPGSSVHEIFQAIIPEWVAISFNRAFSHPGIEPESPAWQVDFFFFFFTTELPGKSIMIICVLSHFSRVRLCVTLWTVACQASPSMGFSKQEYWSGLPCPFPGDFPDLGSNPGSLTSLALTGSFFTTSTTMIIELIIKSQTVWL